MNRYFSYIAILILLASGSVSAETFQKRKKKKGGDPKTIHLTSKDQQGKGEYLFVKAMGFYLSGDYYKAIPLFKQADKIEPSNAATKFNLARCYGAIRNQEEKEAYAKKAFDLEPKNHTYASFLASIYDSKQDHLKVADIYQTLIEESQNKKRRDYFELAQAHFRYAQTLSNQLNLLAPGSKKHSKVKQDIDEHINITLSTYNDFEDIFGLTYEVTSTKINLYFHLNEAQKAFDESWRFVQKENSDIDYFYHHCQDFYKYYPDEVMSQLEEFVGSYNPNAKLKLLMHDFYNLRDENDKAQNILQEAFDNQTLPLEDKAKIILSYTNPEDSTQMKTAQKLAKLAVKHHDQEPLAHSLYGDVLIRNNERNEAVSSYEKALDLDPSNIGVWEQILRIHSVEKNYQRMIATADKALKKDSLNPSFWWYKGVAHIIEKEYKQAVFALESGLENTSNPSMKIDFYRNLGDAYNNLKIYDKSDRAFEKVLLYDPNDDITLNNYSYFLSLRGEKLNQAEAMCKRLMRLVPDEPTYLDTYAWVLYKLGKYDEAVVLLERALQKSDDGTIIEHYGDALFKLGQLDAAILQWKKAQATGAASDLIDKKIANRQLYEE